MDAAILASRGAYFDRNEFVSEAVWDRLAEEGLTSAPAGVDGIVEETAHWRLDAAVTVAPPTASRAAQSGHNFGLNNRDLPTLWALADLMITTSENLEWSKYFEVLRQRAQATGRWLRKQDADHRAPVKAAVGFPRDGAKSKASEDRFLNTAVGSPRNHQGPAFLMGLMAIDAESAALRPTPEGAALLVDLATAGLSASLPQP